MTSRNYILTVAASAFLLSGCGGSAVLSNPLNSQSELSRVRANSILTQRQKVSAGTPTLSGGVVSGSATFTADLSQGDTETLDAKLYEGSKVVAHAKKTVHGPALPFSIKATYACKGTTNSAFHTYASGKGLFNQTATSATVTLACS